MDPQKTSIRQKLFTEISARIIKYSKVSSENNCFFFPMKLLEISDGRQDKKKKDPPKTLFFEGGSDFEMLINQLCPDMTLS